MKRFLNKNVYEIENSINDENVQSNNIYFMRNIIILHSLLIFLKKNKKKQINQ